MTKRELIKALQDDPSDLNIEVMFLSDYGDRGHTIIASPIIVIQEEFVEYSEYHRNEAVIDDDRSDEDGVRTVLTLATTR